MSTSDDRPADDQAREEPRDALEDRDGREQAGGPAPRAGEDDLKARVAALEARLASIEQRLGGTAAAPAPGATPPPSRESTSTPQRADRAPPPPPPRASAPAADAGAPSPLASTLARRRREADAAAPPTATPVRAPAATRGAAPTSSGAPTVSFESFVGGRGAAVVGAIVIVIGAALAVALGIQSGWFSGMPPALRFAGIAAFGAGLLAAGELLQRRLGRGAAIGAFSAGLGVLYVDAFAAFRFFELVGEGGALLLMALVSSIALALTLRATSAFIGTLALLFGYAAPILVGGEGGGHLALLSWISALLATGLALSAVRPRPFRRLRFVAIGGALVVGGLWLAADGETSPAAAVVYLAIWWALVAAEASWAAVRRQTKRLNVVAVVIATGFMVTGGSWVLDAARAAGSPTLVGVFHGMTALLCFAAAFQLGGGVEVVRRRPRFASELLGVSFAVLGAALATTAIAFQFDGFGRSAGWLALGMAAVAFGRRVAATAPARTGTILLVLGGLQVITIDQADPVLDAAIAEIAGATFDRWFVLGLFAVLVLFGASVCMPRRAARTGRVAAVLAVAIWLVGTVRLLPDGGEAGSVLVLAAGLLAIHWWMASATGTASPADAAETPRALVPPPGAIGAWWPLAAVLLCGGVVRAILDLASGLAPRFLDEGAATPTGAVVVPVLTALAAVPVAMLLVRGTDRMPEVEVDGVRRLRWPDARTTGLVLLMLAGAAILSVRVTSDLVDLEAATSFVEGTDRQSELHAAWYAGAWVLLGGVFTALGVRLRGRTGLDAVALGPAIVLAGSAGVLAAYLVAVRASDGITAWRPFLNAPAAVVLLAVAFAVALGRLLRRPLPGANAARPIAGSLLVAAAPVLVLVIVSLELERVFAGDRTLRLASLSIWWAASAVTAVVVGFAQRSPAVRIAGLALLGVTTLKVLAVDLSEADDIWRVVSVVVTGLVLLATSVVYLRAERATRAADAGDDEDQPPGGAAA